MEVLFTLLAERYDRAKYVLFRDLITVRRTDTLSIIYDFGKYENSGGGWICSCCFAIV